MIFVRPILSASLVTDNMQTGNIRAAREYTNMIIFGINAIKCRNPGGRRGPSETKGIHFSCC